MLKYRCLVLDHDDTVVQSEATVNYPYFCQILSQLRPGEVLSPAAYIEGCCRLGFMEMCRQRYGFTDAEFELEYRGWKEYVQTHIPTPYPGIGRILRRQRENGGAVCVVSQSTKDIILRDYRTHFAMVPDAVYGWELPEARRKPSPYALEDIMTRYSLTPKDLLLVDDMRQGWEMARQAGIDVAFAAWGRQDYPEILADMTRRCDYSFHTTEALENFLFD